MQPKAFAVVNDVFSEEEIEELLLTISAADKTKETFRKTDDLFAIRRFFKEVPSAIEKIFTPHFTQLLKALFGDEFFVVKSIYFDKPPTSNWFVAYHQDLTISVDRKSDVEGFGPWTTKPGQFAVQPPLSILEDNVTVRIHLDDTTEESGALKVISGSHRNGNANRLQRSKRRHYVYEASFATRIRSNYQRNQKKSGAC